MRVFHPTSFSQNYTYKPPLYIHPHPQKPLNSPIFTPLNPNRKSNHYSHTLHDQNPDLAPSIFLKFDQKTMNSRSVAVAFIGFVFMALFGVNRAQEFAPVPAPVPGNDGAAIDQGVAYLLLLVALAITYLVH
ncbi:putative arabinogalactan protein/22/41 [Helianthus annuus]|nr:putative arabinogalactan protein/22/41 [Helianthus annuus]KAJ0628888.1 putative arabinogalactan protein/22/41 [Helianthus annuus]